MRTFKIAVLAISFILSATGKLLAEPLVVTVQGPETSADTRYDYDHAVIRLALEKTEQDYGDFIMHVSPTGQNSQRALTAATRGTYENYVVKFSASNKLAEEAGIIPFPVDLGIVGYRVAFVSHKTKEKLASVETIDQLKAFNIVQGIGWLDTSILRNHGFDVRTIEDYDSMFRMVALNRMDLFLRGANELLGEWNTHKTIPQLTYDDAVSIYYPLPRFLVTAKENTKLIERLQTGLVRAYEDGSLIALWEDKYRPSIDFVKLQSRTIFRLTNPYISNIDPSWEKYVYQALMKDKNEKTSVDEEKKYASN